METRVTIDIKASPEQVWQVMTDVERWHEWTASITSVKMQSQPFDLGAKARIKQPRLPEAVWTVTDLQPGQSFTWKYRSPGVKSVATHEVANIGSYGSGVTLTVRQEGIVSLLMMPFMAGLSRRYVAMEAEGLKRRCELEVAAGVMLGRHALAS